MLHTKEIQLEATGGYECRTCGGIGYTSDWPEEIRPDSTISICHRCQTNELNEECDG